MAVIVKQGLIAGSKIVQTFAGYDFTEVWFVSGLDPTSQEPVEIQVLYAYDSVKGIGVPQFGEYYPWLPNCRVFKIETSEPTASTCKLLVNWKTPTSNAEPWFGDGLRVKQGVTINRQETVYYVNDDGIPQGPMTVTAYGGSTQEQRGEAEAFVPQMTFDLTRRMKAFPTVDSLVYTSKTNSDVWRNFVEGSVLCTGITGYSDDGELSYIVTYSFQVSLAFDKDSNNVGWKAPVVWKDPQKNNQPQAMFDSNNLRYYQVQGSAVFADMYGGAQLAGTTKQPFLG